MQFNLRSRRFQIKVPPNEVDPIGVKKLRDWLANRVGLYLPDDWNWTWCIEGKGDFVGKLPARVAKYGYVNQRKMSDQQIAEFGTLAATYVTKDTSVFYADFCRRFNWRGGDFGDSGSCFFSGDRPLAKKMIHDNGGVAIRFYRDNKYDVGFARAWVALHKELLVVFNGYGMETKQIARLLSLWFENAPYKQVNLFNSDKCRNLYMNGNSGFVLGPQEEIDKITRIDLGWPEPVLLANCRHCKREFPQEQLLLIRHKLLCGTCSAALCARCSRCGGFIEKSRSLEHQTRPGSWCHACYRYMYGAQPYFDAVDRKAKAELEARKAKRKAAKITAAAQPAIA